MTNRSKNAPRGLSMKRSIIALIVSIMLALLAAGVFTLIDGYTKSARTKVELQNTYRELQLKQIELDKSKLDSQENQKKIEELSKQLQAKRDSARALAESAAVTSIQPSYAPSGTKDEWLSASGIPASLWGYVDWLVSRESGWKPCAYNPRRNDCNANPSSACGLVQQYPCHKIPGDWRDPVAALRWQYNYVTVRYGGYPQAVAYWKIHGNY